MGSRGSSLVRASVAIALAVALAACNAKQQVAATTPVTSPVTSAAPTTSAASSPGSPAARPSASTSRTSASSARLVVVPGGVLPDRSLTPGSVFATVGIATICTSGYTASARHVTDAQRHEVFGEYGIPYDRHAAYELDHLIPLELGGDNRTTNLWPQPYADKGAGHKDRLENQLHNLVCAHRLSLALAQQAIRDNWVAAYARYGGAAYATGTPSAAPAPPPQPPATPVPAPTVTPTPTPSATHAAATCGAPANPWGFNFCGGSLIDSPPASFCSYFSCIDNFPNGKGYVVECRDGRYSRSGGRSGACSYHGGVLRPLYS